MKTTKISETEETVEALGHTITKNIGGIPTQCAYGASLVVKLGQRVYSNGRFGPLEGTLGIVVGINIPGDDGRTTDVVDVWFEGEHHALHMKFKDLQIEKLVETA